MSGSHSHRNADPYEVVVLNDAGEEIDRIGADGALAARERARYRAALAEVAALPCAGGPVAPCRCASCIARQALIND